MNEFTSVVINSEAVAASITLLDDAGFLVYQVPVVYIKDTITTIGGYITDNYTISTSDKEGYIMYIEN